MAECDTYSMSVTDWQWTVCELRLPLAASRPKFWFVTSHRVCDSFRGGTETCSALLFLRRVTYVLVNNLSVSSPTACICTAFWFISAGIKSSVVLCKARFVQNVFGIIGNSRPSTCTEAGTNQLLLLRLQYIWTAVSSDRAVQGVGLRLLACWDCGFESRRWHGCLVSCECCELSGRGLCDELFSRPEESYRLWCVWVWSWSLLEEAVTQWSSGTKRTQIRLDPSGLLKGVRSKTSGNIKSWQLVLCTSGVHRNRKFRIRSNGG